MSEVATKKTTIRIPDVLEVQIDRAAQRMGNTKAGFLNMGAMFLLLNLADLDDKQQRVDLLKEVEIIFQRMMTDLRERL